MKRSNNSGIRNVSKNVGFGIANNVITLFLSFLVRSFFVAKLGSTYVGLNSLFSNVLGILSFAELGIGVAVTASLYRPLQENNIVVIKGFLNFYRKFMNIVALIIVLLGGIIGLVIPYLIHGNPGISNFKIWLFFVLYAASSAVSYLMSYKRILLTADQSDYMNQVNNAVFISLVGVSQIIILIFWKSYLWYLTVQIIFKLLSNLVISNKINEKYENIFKNKLTEKLDEKHVKELKHSIIGMISAKAGGIVLTSTDNILISAFVGLNTLGLYNNYTMVINGLTIIINQILNSLTPSIGSNRFATDGKEDENRLFNQILGSNYLLVLIISWGVSLFISTFIQIWLNKSFLIATNIVVLIIINFGINAFRQSVIVYTNAYGLFWAVRYKSILEALMNVITSFLLIKYTGLGIEGVLIGTMLTNLLLNLPWEIYIVRDHALKSLKLRAYFGKYLFLFTTLVIAVSFGVWVSTALLQILSIFKTVGVLIGIFFMGTMLLSLIVRVIYKDAIVLLINKMRLIRLKIISKR